MRRQLPDFFDPNRSLFRFILGTAALTALLTVIYDSIKERQGIGGVWFWSAALILVIVLLIVVPEIRRRLWPVRWRLSDANVPTPRAGLILITSPRLNTAPAAIDFHLPALRYLWLVATRESLGCARELRTIYEDRVPHIRLGDTYLVDGQSAAATYDVVAHILEDEAPDVGLDASDVIADITGGPKPMTAGMTLACLTRNRDIQYMRSVRDTDGQPVTDGPLEPILLDLSPGNELAGGLAPLE